MKICTVFSLIAFTFAAAASFDTAADIDPRMIILESAVDNNMPELAARAIGSGVSVDAPITREGVTALMLSAELGKIEMINYLTSVGASLRTVDNIGYTALHFACSPQGSTEGLKACLAIGGADADLNQKESEQGNTALHFAAVNGSIDKVKALVEAGAQIDIQNNIGNTPLIAACIKDNVLIVAYLISKGADFLEVNSNDQDALAIASRNNSMNVARVLLRRIVPSTPENSQVRTLNTGILRAIGYARTEEMRTLLQEFFPATISYVIRPSNI